MSKTFLILFSIVLIGCGGGSETLNLPDITTTTNSEEARVAFFKALDNYDNGGNWEQRRTLLNQALTLDPNFLLAKGILYSNLGAENNNSVLKDVFDKRGEVSDMESKIIEFLYNQRINNDPEVASYNITMLTDEYPELWRLWYWSGLWKSFNPGEIYESIDDLETALEINPNHFGTKLMLLNKHLQIGRLGLQLPTDEIDLDYLKSMIEDIEKNHSDLGFTFVVVGNYYRTINEFDKAIESYAKLEDYQDQGIQFLNQSYLYRALANTFKGDYGEAESFFRRRLELDGSSYGIFSQMFLFKNDFEGAVDILNEWEEKLISLELPAQQELNAIVNINQTKFLCFAHNQLEEESLQHIQFTKEARVNSINLRKSRLSDEQYNEQILIAEYIEETLKIWHDILFGSYNLAKEKLVPYKSISDKINSPNNLHNYYVLSALVDLNLGDSESSIRNFEMTNKNNGFFGTQLDQDYYTYFKALALKANGKIEESNSLFQEIASKNFYGIQSALVRNLAIAQL